MREYLLRRLLLLIPTLLGVTFIVFLMMRFINMRSVSFFKGTQSDYMGINDPHLEALVYQWRRTMEPEQRKAISADIQRLLAEQLY
jgi:ABC-type dipeptide/oligopeptide/nickel transport system permease component